MLCVYVSSQRSVKGKTPPRWWSDDTTRHRDGNVAVEGPRLPLWRPHCLLITCRAAFLSVTSLMSHTHWNTNTHIYRLICLNGVSIVIVVFMILLTFHPPNAFVCLYCTLHMSTAQYDWVYLSVHVICSLSMTKLYPKHISLSTSDCYWSPQPALSFRYT